MSSSLKRLALVCLVAVGALATSACSGWNACDPFHPQGPSVTDLKDCGGCDCSDHWGGSIMPCDCR